MVALLAQSSDHARMIIADRLKRRAEGEEIDVGEVLALARLWGLPDLTKIEQAFADAGVLAKARIGKDRAAIEAAEIAALRSDFSPEHNLKLSLGNQHNLLPGRMLSWSRGRED